MRTVPKFVYGRKPYSFQKRIEETVDEVLKLYEKGHSMRDVARCVGIDRTTVRRILIRSGRRA